MPQVNVLCSSLGIQGNFVMRFSGVTDDQVLTWYTIGFWSRIVPTVLYFKYLWIKESQIYKALNYLNFRIKYFPSTVSFIATLPLQAIDKRIEILDKNDEQRLYRKR